MKPLKILQVINSLPSAGAEKLVVETSKRFVQHGHKVSLVLLNPETTQLYKEMLEHPEIELFIMSDSLSIYNPLQIRKISRHLKKYNYDIVHVHLFPSFYWTALAKKSAGTTKFVHTEHNTNNRRMNNAFYGKVDRHIYKRYDCHIAISKTVRENLEKHIDTNSNTIATIYNGIDLEAINKAEAYSKKELGLEENDLLILQVSAFRPQKNQSTLIESLSKLDKNVHVFFAGDGVLKEKCQELARDLDLTDRVHFLGVRNDIPRLLKTADIVVLSSHYEGLSLSSVEGLASGKPFVASDVPGLTEVVKNAGILFPDNDATALAKALEKLIKDPEHYQETVQKCRERSKMYDMKIMVSSYLDLYMKLLNRS